nr:HU family DNA-binding protein [Celeribacter halophilus]
MVTVVKKKDLIEKVTEASGVKRSEAKKVIEAMLKELGDALQREDELNLPPLGKMSVNRIREGSGAHIIIAKLRRPKAMLGEVTPPASTADDTAVDEA